MATSADRRRAQRRIAREIRENRYKPSSVGRQARQAAAKVREDRNKRIIDLGPDLRGLAKRRKREFWADRIKFRLHAELIDQADPEALEEFLQMSEDEAEEQIQRTVRAMRGQGEFEDHDLDFGFLFYH